MIRTQIQLTEEQARALRQRAAAEGRSMADLVRDGVDRLLEDRAERDREETKRRSIDALGRFHSGTADLGSAHDRHLGEAFEER
jgi:plasmid stability protein